ncbi:hypothetical protein PTKU15_84150 [Paraburkholderia terrae]|nr:hypothetical protein PTKU15_84150 [Paraburkholderia terrae]
MLELTKTFGLTLRKPRRDADGFFIADLWLAQPQEPAGAGALMQSTTQIRLHVASQHLQKLDQMAARHGAMKRKL